MLLQRCGGPKASGPLVSGVWTLKLAMATWRARLIYSGSRTFRLLSILQSLLWRQDHEDMPDIGFLVQFKIGALQDHVLAEAGSVCRTELYI